MDLGGDFIADRFSNFLRDVKKVVGREAAILFGCICLGYIGARVPPVPCILWLLFVAFLYMLYMVIRVSESLGALKRGGRKESARRLDFSRMLQKYHDGDSDSVAHSKKRARKGRRR